MALRFHGNAKRACAEIRRGTANAYKADPDFAARWDAMLAEGRAAGIAKYERQRKARDAADRAMPNRDRFDGLMPRRQCAFPRAPHLDSPFPSTKPRHDAFRGDGMHIRVTISATCLTVAAVSGPVAAQQTEPVITQGTSVAGARPAPLPPPKLDDSAGTTDANTTAAAKADAATRKIIGDKEAYKASVDKSIADYDAKMEEYRRQVRDNEARNAEIRRRNEARTALYKACVAGDKAACAQYNSGQ